MNNVPSYNKTKLFNDWASSYNESVKKSDKEDTYPFSGYLRIKREIFDLVTNYDNTRVLEMGIGTGEITYPIYKLGFDITGVDYSYEMIKKSKELMPNAKFIQNDFLSVIKDIEGELFDVIIFNYSIHHLNYNNQKRLLESLLNNLSPKGIVVVGDVMTNSNNEMKELSIKYGPSWDEEEDYPTYEIYNNHVLSESYNIEYKHISHCSGLLILNKK